MEEDIAKHINMPDNVLISKYKECAQFNIIKNVFYT